MLTDFVYLGLGWLLIAVGLIVLPMPLPLGLPLIAIGSWLVLSRSPAMRRRVALLRRRFPVSLGWLRRLVARLPRQLRLLVRRTDPDRLDRMRGQRERGPS